MAITDPDTVFVIGAGVSAPFGLPLGGDLISEISKMLHREHDALFRAENPRRVQRLRAAASSPTGFKNFPVYGAVARKYFDTETQRLESLYLDLELEKLNSLRTLLEDQTSETIDDFIVENPSYAELTKICICASFIMNLYTFKDHSLHVNALSSRYVDTKKYHTRSWIHLLINIVRHGIRAGKVTSQNKVRIITFNYDKVLEWVLEEQFSNTEKGYSHYSDYIEIIHVHGECGELLPTLPDPALTCLEWSQGIHVINQNTVPNDILEKREKAKAIIMTAKELYFCGFSFAGPNCRMLGLANPKPARWPRREIIYANFDGNVGIRKTVQQLKKESGILNISTKKYTVSTHLEEVAGTSEHPVGVSEWLKLGYLGELPG